MLLPVQLLNQCSRPDYVIYIWHGFCIEFVLKTAFPTRLPPLVMRLAAPTKSLGK